MPIHFIRPSFLFLLLPLLFALLYLYRSPSNTSRWRRACDPHLLNALLQKGNLQKRKLRFLFFSVASCLAILALAGPSLRHVQLPVYQSADAVMMVYDMSPSMLAEDIQPNRLARSKFKIHDFLKRRQSGQVGFVAFSEYAYMVTPLTHDPDTLAALIPELSPGIMPKHGSRIEAGLEKGLALLESGNAKSGSILLITDSEPSEKAFELAEQARSKGFTVNVYAIGEAAGAPIPIAGSYLQDDMGNVIIAKVPMARLEKLAQAGGGQLIRFSKNNADIERLLSLSRGHAISHDKKKRMSSQWRDDGLWLVWIVLIMSAFAFRPGWFEEFAHE